MSRFAVGTIATGAGLTGATGTGLPFGSLYGATTVTPRIREIGLFNTTTTACSVKLVRLTAAGTKGASITVPGATTLQGLNAVDPSLAVATAFQAHSVAPAYVETGYRCQIGAAIGSATIWTFDDWELTIAASATAGLGFIPDAGTGQIISWYIKWIE